MRSSSRTVRAIPLAWPNSWRVYWPRELRCSAPRGVEAEGGVFPAGTYVVRLDQPYRNYAVDLLSPQHYPKMPVSRTTTSRVVSCALSFECDTDCRSGCAAANLTQLTETPHVKGAVAEAAAGTPVRAYLLKDTGRKVCWKRGSGWLNSKLK